MLAIVYAARNSSNKYVSGKHDVLVQTVKPFIKILKKTFAEAPKRLLSMFCRDTIGKLNA